MRNVCNDRGENNSFPLMGSPRGRTIVNRLLHCFISRSHSTLQQPFQSRSQPGDFQKTIGRAISRSGIGLHTGIIAHLKLLPAAAGEGRYFVHFAEGTQTQDKEVRVAASIHSVKETTLSTCIGEGQVRIRTVEHLLSALEGLGVDNCRIEIKGGNEVPILDGSARMWVEAVREAGLAFALDKGGTKVPRNSFVLIEPLFVPKVNSFIAAFPSLETRISYGIDFQEAPAIGSQWFSIHLGDTFAYEDKVAPARTFCIAEQVAELQAAGLIKGGSVENAIICSAKDGWINQPLRFSDEPCRHKLLDLVGDLALCAENGNPGLPCAHIVAFKAGHLLHTEFAGALLNFKRSREIKK